MKQPLLNEVNTAFAPEASLKLTSDEATTPPTSDVIIGCEIPFASEDNQLSHHVSLQFLRDRSIRAKTSLVSVGLLTLLTGCGKSSHATEVANTVPVETSTPSPAQTSNTLTTAPKNAVSLSCQISGSEAASIAGAPTTLLPQKSGGYVKPAICEYALPPKVDEYVNTDAASVTFRSEDQTEFNLSSMIRDSPGAGNVFSDRPEFGNGAWELAGTGPMGNVSQIHFPWHNYLLSVAVFEPTSSSIPSHDAAVKLVQLIENQS